MQRKDLHWLVGELRGLTEDLGSLSQPGGHPLVLVIDQGGHASRTMVFDLSGRRVAEAYAPISTYRPREDRVEHDPVEILESIKTAIADVATTLGPDTKRIVAAGLATQRSSIVCWNRRNGAPLSPVLSWQDRRHSRWLEAWQPHAAEVRHLTGLVLSPHYGVSKLRWCLDELPSVREAASRRQLAAGPLASWLLRQLLNERPFVIDPANAARTLLFDLATGDWSARLLELAGLSRDLMPHCVPSRHDFGSLPVGDHEVPLVVCTGDQSAAPFAHGQPDNSTIHLNVGTGAFLQCPLKTAQDLATPLLQSIVWRDARGPLYSLEGTVNGAGSALDWLDDQTGLDDHRAAKSLTRDQAAHLEIPVFLNGVSGIGSPWWLPHVESRFLDGSPDDELPRVAAVVESIAFLIAGNVVEMRRLQPGIERIRAGGGLADSDYLCTCVADVTGLPVERTDLKESTATGLAFLTAGAPADWNPAAGLTAFTPQANAALTARHRRWAEAMAGLKNAL